MIVGEGREEGERGHELSERNISSEDLFTWRETLPSVSRGFPPLGKFHRRHLRQVDKFVTTRHMCIREPGRPHNTTRPNYILKSFRV